MIALLFALCVLAFSDCEADGVAALSQIDNADHGDTQVTWLIHDRPHLGEIVSPGNSIWNWLRDAFDYEGDGEKLYWDPTPSPATEIYGGQTSFLGNSKIIFVHLDPVVKEGPQAGADKTAEELLRAAVFELNNARHRPQVRDIGMRALEGKLSRDQYILAMAGTEFVSSQGTKKFETEIWDPFCNRWQIKSDANIWIADQPATFDEWIKLFPAGSIYPWKVYGLEYDQLIAKYNEALHRQDHH